ncbi:MAG: transposase [Bacteroidota bacterium]
MDKIHEKGYKNKPLSDLQKESNRIKSSKRARVEHIFGFIETNMKGTCIRTIGIARAKVNIGITNLTYNICRAVQLGINMFTVDTCVQS